MNMTQSLPTTSGLLPARSQLNQQKKFLRHNFQENATCFREKFMPKGCGEVFGRYLQASKSAVENDVKIGKICRIVKI